MSQNSVSSDARCIASQLLAVLPDWAAEADDAPAADSTVAELFAALAASGPAADYADAIASAAVRAATAPASAKQAIIDALDRTMAGLNETIVPSDLSKLAATISIAATPRVGETRAGRLAGATITRQVVIPRIHASAGAADAAMAAVIAMALEDLADDVPFGTRTGSRLGALQPEFSRLAETYDAWVRDLVAGGRFALAISVERPDVDPDDVVTQAEAIIASDEALADAFLPPTPDDPLGTGPRYGLTAIGQAIEAARRERSTDYDWGAVQDLADDSPAEFAALLRDERLHVLERVRL